ncbi:MAG: hemolysin family protein [Gemmatimonadetes bacterium]|nr:hemolysin family protein [Gemmatimonadota bacterium]
MIPVLGGVASMLLATSAILTAAETAAFGIGVSRLRTLLEEGFGGARELSQLRSRPVGFQTALHLLVTILNLLAVGLTVVAGAIGWGTRGALLALGLTVIMILVAAEILPRGLAARRPVRLALGSAPFLLKLERGVRVMLGPVLRLEDLVSGRNGEEDLTPEERVLHDLTELGREEGVLGADEHLLVERAFRLDELAAWDVMTPRVDIFAWRDDLPLEDIIGGLKAVPYSRVPVYGESVDDVTGILYVREAYETYVAGRGGEHLARLSREPFFVPGSMPLSDLLRAFQSRRIHMGIVADEFGGTDGLVTLEDVLEELVGDIVDETDVEDEDLIRVSRTELLADGTVDLREINHAFNVSLPQLEHRSLNGFILEELGRVPDNGETFTAAGVEFEILEASETQVQRARLRRLPEPEGRPVPDDAEED